MGTVIETKRFGDRRLTASAIKEAVRRELDAATAPVIEAGIRNAVLKFAAAGARSAVSAERVVASGGESSAPPPARNPVPAEQPNPGRVGAAYVEERAGKQYAELEAVGVRLSSTRREFIELAVERAQAERAKRPSLADDHREFSELPEVRKFSHRGPEALAGAIESARRYKAFAESEAGKRSRTTLAEWLSVDFSEGEAAHEARRRQDLEKEAQRLAGKRDRVASGLEGVGPPSAVKVKREQWELNLDKEIEKLADKYHVNTTEVRRLMAERKNLIASGYRLESTAEDYVAANAGKSGR